MSLMMIMEMMMMVMMMIMIVHFMSSEAADPSFPETGTKSTLTGWVTPADFSARTRVHLHPISLLELEYTFILFLY